MYTTLFEYRGFILGRMTTMEAIPHRTREVDNIRLNWLSTFTLPFEVEFKLIQFLWSQIAGVFLIKSYGCINNGWMKDRSRVNRYRRVFENRKSLMGTAWHAESVNSATA